MGRFGWRLNFRKQLWQNVKTFFWTKTDFAVSSDKSTQNKISNCFREKQINYWRWLNSRFEIWFHSLWSPFSATSFSASKVLKWNSLWWQFSYFKSGKNPNREKSEKRMEKMRVRSKRNQLPNERAKRKNKIIKRWLPVFVNSVCTVFQNDYF